MAQPRPRSTASQDTGAATIRSSRPRHLSEASGSESSAASPALGLQQQLGDAFNAPSTADDGHRWSPKATILVSGGAAAGLWLAIAAGVWAIARIF